ncbi:hypothetical protein BDFB_011598, partial [Asbolus verrucosus]
TPASGFPGVEDDLVFSGAGSGCNGDDEDECPPLPETGSGDDDLITPVYIPPTRPPPTTKRPHKPPQEEVPSVSITTPDNTSVRIPSTTIGQQTSGSTIVVSTTDKGLEFSSTTPQHTSETTLIVSTENITTSTEKITFRPPYNHQVPLSEEGPHDPYHNHKPTQKQTERVTSETAEIVAFVIGIIAAILIAIVLVILMILKFKSRGNRSFKVDDGKGYQQGPNAALLGHTSSTNGHQTQYQLNGALRNGDKSQMQKSKKRDSKDIKEWYV